MVSVPIADTNPNGGTGFSENSKCHLVIEGVEDKIADQGFPHVAVTFLCVASTVESQVGKKRTEQFSFKPPQPGKKPPVNRFLELACALGVYSKPQWNLDVEAKRDPNFELESMIGRSCCAPVTIKKFDEKYWTDQLKLGQSTGDTKKIEKAEKQLAERPEFPSVGGDYGYTFWALGDADSDQVPLDPDWLTHFNDPARGDLAGTLPTKQGTYRRRGDKGTPPAGSTAPSNPAPVTPPAGNTQPPQAPAGTAPASFF